MNRIDVNVANEKMQEVMTKVDVAYDLKQEVIEEAYVWNNEHDKMEIVVVCR